MIDINHIDIDRKGALMPCRNEAAKWLSCFFIVELKKMAE